MHHYTPLLKINNLHNRICFLYHHCLYKNQLPYLITLSVLSIFLSLNHSFQFILKYFSLPYIFSLKLSFQSTYHVYSRVRDPTKWLNHKIKVLIHILNFQRICKLFLIYNTYE